MSIELITVLLFLCVFVLLSTGIPVAFAMGATAVIFCISFWGIDRIAILGTAVLSNIGNVNFVAIPLFLLMGWIIYAAGIADDLFKTMNMWLGRIRGGLAMGSIFIGAVFGAICGDLVAGIFTLTTISFTSLMKHGYAKTLAIPSVMCGGLLSFLVPPSILVIIYCSITSQSIGKVYLACFIPGFLLVLIYIIYQIILTARKPELVPPIIPSENVTWRERFNSLKGVILPIMLILVMLGGIYAGIVTPMEASAVGAAGAFLVAVIKRRLNWQVVKVAASSTAQLTAMIGWMIMCCGAFTNVYYGIGAQDLVLSVATAMPGGGLPVIIVMNVILIILGMILDATPIVLIFGPIFSSIAINLGFDPVWFAVVFIVNICCGLLSPPYGFALFIQKAAIAGLPEHYDVSLMEIMRSAIPYCLAHVLLLILLLAFPVLATWLPNWLIG